MRFEAMVGAAAPSMSTLCVSSNGTIVLNDPLYCSQRISSKYTNGGASVLVVSCCCVFFFTSTLAPLALIASCVPVSQLGAKAKQHLWTFVLVHVVMRAISP